MHFIHASLVESTLMAQSEKKMLGGHLVMWDEMMRCADEASRLAPCSASDT